MRVLKRLWWVGVVFWVVFLVGVRVKIWVGFWVVFLVGVRMKVSLGGLRAGVRLGFVSWAGGGVGKFRWFLGWTLSQGGFDWALS